MGEGGFVFAPAPRPAVKVAGGGLFPVRRILCVGRNYTDHVSEMGGDPKDVPPTFFSKPADAVCPGGALPYPPMTGDLHYEGELVVALGPGALGPGVQDGESVSIFGYAAGCDLTRRDLQAEAKKCGSPWDMAKGFDNSAVIGEIVQSAETGGIAGASLTTRVNGKTRQQASLSQMIWPVEDIIAALSRHVALKPGDLIYTGTPAGVGPVTRGDTVRVEIDGLSPVSFELV